MRFATSCFRIVSLAGCFWLMAAGASLADDSRAFTPSGSSSEAAQPAGVVAGESEEGVVQNAEGAGLTRQSDPEDPAQLSPACVVSAVCMLLPAFTAARVQPWLTRTLQESIEVLRRALSSRDRAHRNGPLLV